jgi:general secretion pathway protein G
MAIESCENCKRIIGELEQAYTWQRHIVCKECYTRLSTPVGGNAPVIQPPPQRSLVKSTLVVMATVAVVIVIIPLSFKCLSSLDASLQKAMVTDKERATTTKTSLIILADAVSQFKLDTGRFPTQQEGLRALIVKPLDATFYPDGGYLKAKTMPIDAWGHEFIYHLNPESGAPFEIMSYGADGKPGGEGINADLRNTDAE